MAAKKKAVAAKKKAAAKKVAARRADFGKPIDGFVKKQPAALRAIVEALEKLVREAAPEAEASLKWGQAFFAIGDSMMCAVGAHKAHVNLILPGADGTYDDPDGLLEGTGKTGKHLKVVDAAKLPKKAVQKWLKAAAARARSGAPMRHA